MILLRQVLALWSCAMRTISVSQFRRDAKRVLGSIKRGQSIVLTYRGRPIARLEPVEPDRIALDDPFYRIAESAIDGGNSKRPVSNAEMDRQVYGY
jgi:prevent-host-death family protein